MPNFEAIAKGNLDTQKTKWRSKNVQKQLPDSFDTQI